MNTPNPAVDFYFSKNKHWLAELEHLRTLVLAGGLTEELKWGVPCYTFQKKNICLLHVFKEYCAILFVKGALLQDAQGVLVRQTENTQATRQIRFTSGREVLGLEATLKAYIQEAIDVEKRGLKVSFKESAAFSIPEEFQRKLTEIPALKAGFAGLTPGRQRAYILYFSAAKQAKTREARVEKWLPQILGGRGLDD